MSKNLKLIHTEKDEFSKPVKYYTDENNFLYRRDDGFKFYYPEHEGLLVHKNKDYIEITDAYPGVKLSNEETPIICSCGSKGFSITYGEYSVIAKCESCGLKEEVYSG